ncbi:MAG: hypothetical protein LAT51_02665 [Flavobacteriaceae bacterium]|nr:hypothetical protein [Flavobacteriaceae bacterium]
MKNKFILIIGILFFIFNLQKVTAQTKLFQSLNEGMKKSEFEKEIKENALKYNQINFGKDVVWEIDSEFCVFEDEKLKVVVMKPAGNKNGINYIKTVNHLKTSKEYLIQRSYKVLNEHELWYSPQRFVDEKYPYAILFEGPQQEVVVKINTERFKGNYMPSISITSIKNKNLFEKKEEIYSESGF